MKIDPALFEWDPYSDQPHIIKNKRAKRLIGLRCVVSHLKSLVITLLLIVPVSVIGFFSRKQMIRPIACRDFFGLCVNLDKEPDLTPALVKELGIKKLLVRVPLADVDNLQRYDGFIQSLIEQVEDAEVTVCVLQDRMHIENPAMLQSAMRKIFSGLQGRVSSFQIGNAVNRLKWGFATVEEYLDFYQRVQQLRDREFPGLVLLGSSVIDFEPVSTLRSLFHGLRCRYDKMAALLYVDRRGAPEGKQFLVFNLANKIRFIAAAALLGKSASDRLVITEANWPLKNTHPWAPAYGECCVSPDDAASYMVRYYLNALATGLVETVYWHQLIAPGYGLVDHRQQPVTRYSGFAALKVMVNHLSDTVLKNYRIDKNGIYRLQFDGASRQIDVLWSLQERPIPRLDADQYYRQDGELLASAPETISGSVVYAVTERINAD